MLDVGKLYAALELVCDPTAPLSVFPSDEDDAKAKWGAAFYVYVKDITPPLPSTGVAAAFAGKLSFTPGLGPMPALHDLAAAWTAAMTSMMTFDGLPALETALRGALTTQLSSPTLVASTRIKAIADAFDSVTKGITSGGGTVVYS